MEQPEVVSESVTRDMQNIKRWFSFCLLVFNDTLTFRAFLHTAYPNMHLDPAVD